MKTILILCAILAVQLSLADGTRDRCLEVLHEGLHSEEFWPSIHAAEALTLAGHGSEVRQYLEPKLPAETDDQKRCGIARELVRAGDKKESSVLLSILSGNDPHGHVHAAESLYKVGWSGNSEPLLLALDSTEDIRLPLMAAAALAKHESGEKKAKALAFLRSTLSETQDTAILRLAAWVMARVGDSSDISRIHNRLPSATDEPSRTTLQHALASLGDPGGKSALIQNLNSSDPVVRAQAATFAGEINIREAIPTLERLLDDTEPDPRIRAAQSLLLLSR